MGTRLYVGSLSYSTTLDRLKEVFAKAGEVTDATVVADKFTGRSKGFGFVEMATAEDAAKAIEMWNGQELDGRRLVVNEARPMAERPPRRFGGGGGGGGGFRRSDDNSGGY